MLTCIELVEKLRAADLSPITFHPLPFAPLRLCVRFYSRPFVACPTKHEFCNFIALYCAKSDPFAVFLAFLVPFLDLRSLGEVGCGYSLFPDRRPRKRGGAPRNHQSPLTFFLFPLPLCVSLQFVICNLSSVIRAAPTFHLSPITFQAASLCVSAIFVS